jgi:chaperonin GroES
MALNLRPLADRVVVEPSEAEEVTTIVAIGTGRRDENGKLIAMDVKISDKVLYAKYAGTEIKVDGKKVLILKESDILAVVE